MSAPARIAQLAAAMGQQVACHEAAGFKGGTSFEQVDLDREGTGASDSEADHLQGGRMWSLNLGCCQHAADTTVEQVTEVQECCLTNYDNSAPAGLIAQRPWNSGGRPHVSRGRLLVPHFEHRFGDYYQVGRKVGEGSFGDVYEAYTQPTDAVKGHALRSLGADAAAGGMIPRAVAVKVFHLTGQQEAASPMVRTGAGGGHQHLTPRSQDQRRSQSFEAERTMLADLEHPHIVRMIECFQESHSLYIVLELCRGGELYQRLVARAKEVGSGGIDEPQSQVLFRQMLHAVGYLHSRKIVHRDLKTENFLLVGELGTPEADTLKLCDFGTASRLSKTKPRSMENIGTLSYTAPEVYASQGAAVAADCWSLGVVLYVMTTGTNPFRAPGKKVDREETVRRIRCADFDQRRQSWQNVSERGQDLIKRFLVLDEQVRLTCTQALRHKWVVQASLPQPMALVPCTPGRGGRGALAVHAPVVISLLVRLPRLAIAQQIVLECCAMATVEADLHSRLPWRELFLHLDADQDGRLSFGELASGLRSLAGGGGPTEEQLEDAVRSLDFDGSGAIEWVEWLVVALLCSKGIAESCEPVSTAFRLLNRPLLHAVDEPSEETLGHIVAQWVPRHSGWDTTSADDRDCTLRDMRLTLASLEQLDQFL